MVVAVGAALAGCGSSTPTATRPAPFNAYSAAVRRNLAREITKDFRGQGADISGVTCRPKSETRMVCSGKQNGQEAFSIAVTLNPRTHRATWATIIGIGA